MIMNVGVIGVGRMGKNHVRVYSELKRVKDIYVYDVDRDAAESMKKFDAVVCDSLDDLLRVVDAVSICVPTSLHFEVLTKVLERGIHTLVEKPITLTFEEGKKVLETLKEKRDVVVGVGHIERFNPIVGEIREIINDPIYVDIKRHNPTSIRITDSSVVEDLMIHDIDIVFHVLFPNREFKIFSAGNRDVSTVLIRFDRSVVTISASRMAAKKIRSIHIEEEDFTIEGDFMSQELFIYRKPEKYRIEGWRYVQENIIEKVLVNKVEPLKVELETFIDCVERGESFPVTPEQAVFNLKICEMVKQHGVL